MVSRDAIVQTFTIGFDGSRLSRESIAPRIVGHRKYDTILNRRRMYKRDATCDAK